MIVLIACCCLFELQAQKDETLFNRTNIQFTGAWGGANIAFSQFNQGGDFFVSNGGFGGIELNKSIFIGWGGMDLEDDAIITIDDIDRSFGFNYNGLILGYAPKSYRVLHPEFKLLVGNGNVNIQDFGRDRVLVVQPSAGVEVNIFQWFRVGLEGGYRAVTNVDYDGIRDSELSNAYGAIKFKFGWSWGN